MYQVLNSRERNQPGYGGTEGTGGMAAGAEAECAGGAAAATSGTPAAREELGLTAAAAGDTEAKS